MSVFNGPEEHAANPPSTWVVVKEGRKYRLQTSAGITLDTFTRKHDAEQAKVTGWLVSLYNKETRWYAGEPVFGPAGAWKPYAEVQRDNPGC